MSALKGHRRFDPRPGGVPASAGFEGPRNLRLVFLSLPLRSVSRHGPKVTIFARVLLPREFTRVRRPALRIECFLKPRAAHKALAAINPDDDGCVPGSRVGG